MSDDSRSFENKLDRDFLFYLNLMKGLFGNLQNDTDKNLCELWLTFLVGKKFLSAAEKCDRNIYLSRLLLQMQAGKLKGVFEVSPPNGDLVPAFSAFGLPSEVEGLKDFEEAGFQIDSNFGGGGDFFESSRDGRTYLATKKIPQGIMAFLAVTNNEGDPIWIPQLDGVVNLSSASEQPSTIEWPKVGFQKALSKFVSAPLCRIRQSPEQIDQVMEWFDKVITDCNKWIQGEDPHNAELENLFERLYNEYKCDPDKAEILNHPRKVRNILIKEIREQIEERREQVASRQLILDQIESEQYVELFQINKDGALDELWMQAAGKPMTDYVKRLLNDTYPQELVQRFFELLYQERLELINQAEQEARRILRIDKDDVVYFLTNELLKLRRVQNEYVEWYTVFKEIEKRYDEFDRLYKEKCGREGTDSNYDEKLKCQIEGELEQAKKKYEKERRIQSELTAKVVEVKACLTKVQDKIAEEEKKMCHNKNEMMLFRDELFVKLEGLKQRRDDLRRQLQCIRERR